MKHKLLSLSLILLLSMSFLLPATSLLADEENSQDAVDLELGGPLVEEPVSNPPPPRILKNPVYMLK